MPRIGLVLGAGGIIGAAYQSGALEGIRRATGWEPQFADLLLGTSAGSFSGAIAAAGVPIWMTHYQCTGEEPRGMAIDAELAALTAAMDKHNEGSWLTRFRPPRRIPRPLLSSPRAVLRGVFSRSTPRSVMLTGLLGEGLFSTRSVGEILRTAFPRGWPTPCLWVSTIQLESGSRVVFGRKDAPAADLHQAVRASCAIPGLFAPVPIGGKRYVDAGVWSACNLDLLAGQHFDLVLCISPQSSLGARKGLADRVARRVRARIHDGLLAEKEILTSAGVPVHVLEPDRDDLLAMPLNAMDLSRRPAVMIQAARSTERRLIGDPELRVVRDLLSAHAREQHRARVVEKESSGP
jgi:NTE family protein